ncbi:MAG: PPOX class F420-dependent oxidoreductase [Pseudonocardiaceae bacterium]
MEYLHRQILGRLATVDGSGAPQNNPVGFRVDEQNGQVLIGGHSLATTRKFRNIVRNANVAFVVDDLASVDPG